MDQNDLASRFTYHPPTPHRADLHERLRNQGGRLAELIDSDCPDSREKSLALTKLEETVMWANAAIARHVP